MPFNPISVNWLFRMESHMGKQRQESLRVNERHAPGAESVSFSQRTLRLIPLDDDASFRTVSSLQDEGALGSDPTHGFARDVASRVKIFTVKTAVQAQWLAPRGSCIQSKHAELDTPRDEALDVHDIQAFIEPVHEEPLGRGAVGADLTRVALLDRGRIRHEGEDAEGDLSECLRQGRATADHTPAAVGVDIREGRGQQPSPTRSP